MVDKIDFENEKISNSEDLVSLTITQWIHTHNGSDSGHMAYLITHQPPHRMCTPNFIL